MNFIMKKQLEMKKGSKKGFTLVEVIVVIVIIAILAAIAVPALTGYIDRAGDRAAVVEARNVGVALQTLASDRGNATLPAAAVDGNETWPGSITIAVEVQNLIGSPIVAANLTAIEWDPSTSALATFTYVTSSGPTVVFTAAAGPNQGYVVQP